MQKARFVCIVPASSATTPARPLLFGHGLFQDETAVDTIALLAVATNAVICGTNFTGMANEDLPNAGMVSSDLSRFPTIADRLQQGILNFMFLGRAMIHPDGLSSNPEFAGRIKTGKLFYGAQPRRDHRRGAHLGRARLRALGADRAGLRFSLLLTRSSQFPTFGSILYSKYTDPVEQSLVNSMIQLLWDRGEANGYAYHMTRNPLPNTPAKTVLLHEAFGDHQVTNVATETEARVIGARLRTPTLDPGRSLDRRPFYGIKPIPRYPWKGNALVVFDIGPLRPPGCGTTTTCLGTPPRLSPTLLPRSASTATRRRSTSTRSPVHQLPRLRRRLRARLRRGQALLRARLDRAADTALGNRPGGLRGACRRRAGGRGGLRPDRPVALPLPVAERLLPRARRLALTASMMPTNASGTPIDPETTTGRTASAPRS